MFFYLMFLNIYYWKKPTFSKFVGIVNFSERKFEEMHELWRAKRCKVYSGKRLFWHYYLQLPFVYNSYLRFLLNCFVREMKGFYQGSVGNEVDSRDIIFPQISWLKIKIFQKTEAWFCRWKSTDSNDINIFLSPENPWTFLLTKYLKTHF